MVLGLFALTDAVLVAIVGLPTALIGAMATLYGTRAGRKRDIDEAVNTRIKSAFEKDDATIARLEAERARLELRVDRLDLRLEEAEKREAECLRRENKLAQKCDELAKSYSKLEGEMQRRREEDT